MTVAHTPAARRQIIADLLARHAVRSQRELADLLAADGIAVTQATLSRDLHDLGAVRLRVAGDLVYALPGEGDLTLKPAPDSAAPDRLARVVADTLVSAEAAQNLVVLRTPPGAAQYLASAVDHSVLTGVAGTIAGDDTVLLIAHDRRRASEVVDLLLGLASGRPAAGNG
jgi:transcriptional regulator of arginine metabolism